MRYVDSAAALPERASSCTPARLLSGKSYSVSMRAESRYSRPAAAKFHAFRLSLAAEFRIARSGTVEPCCSPIAAAELATRGLQLVLVVELLPASTAIAPEAGAGTASPVSSSSAVSA